MATLPLPYANVDLEIEAGRPKLVTCRHEVGDAKRLAEFVLSFPSFSPVTRLFPTKRFPAATWVFLTAMALWTGQMAWGDSAADEQTEALPEPVTEENFEALMESSPFMRSIGLNQSIVLTGVARIEDEVFATLIDLETRQSFLVSEEKNLQGWQLMEVKGDESDLQSLTAQVKIAGSQVVSIRYEKVPMVNVINGGGPSISGRPSSLTPAQADEAKKAALNYREGYSSDGYPKQPPPEIVSKLSRLSVPQREAINRQMIELRNRGLGMEERRKIYEKTVDRTLQGSR